MVRNSHLPSSAPHRSHDMSPEEKFLPWIDCWNCGGDGAVYSCADEIGCIDPESGCDFCERKCDICKGNGGWHGNEEEPS